MGVLQVEVLHLYGGRSHAYGGIGAPDGALGVDVARQAEGDGSLHLALDGTFDVVCGLGLDACEVAAALGEFHNAAEGLALLSVRRYEVVDGRAEVAGHAANLGNDAHGRVVQVLALQQVDAGIQIAGEVSLDGGAHGAAQRHVLRVP